MTDLLRADIYRMLRKPLLWLMVCAMAALSLVFIMIQHTAMDYTVMLDRVIFLPMSFYGVVAAALVSLYIGEDFGGGVIKNKIVAGKSRRAVYLSAQIACWLGAVIVYLLTLTVTIGVGSFLFDVNVSVGKIAEYVALGLLTVLAYGSIFCLISMLAKSKSLSVAICMALSFGMLFLCLHTNQVVIQQALKDGAANPAYATGLKRTLYFILHDLNPSGQAAQLSAMEYFSALRFCLTDVFWICLSAVVGPLLFKARDIR